MYSLCCWSVRWFWWIVLIVDRVANRHCAAMDVIHHVWFKKRPSIQLSRIWMTSRAIVTMPALSLEIAAMILKHSVAVSWFYKQNKNTFKSLTVNRQRITFKSIGVYLFNSVLLLSLIKYLPIYQKSDYENHEFTYLNKIYIFKMKLNNAATCIKWIYRYQQTPIKITWPINNKMFVCRIKWNQK